MAQFPALPLFTDAYLADTLHLTDAQRGIYLKLLMLTWRSPECRLPNDNEWLALRFQRTVERVVSEVRPLIAEFYSNTGNWLTQKRLLKEWEWCKNKSSQQSVRAKLRWEKEKNLYNGNAETHMPE